MLVPIILGLIWGSFLNVVIYRLPRRLSLVSPGSSCPFCRKAIRYFDNIPVLSYLLLQGKCRHCKRPISPRYPLVELASALAASLLYLAFGLSLELFLYFLFISALLALSAIDLATRLLPDVITLPLVVIGLAFSFFSTSLAPWDSMLGIAGGGGFFMLISWGYSALRGRPGLGGGDVKLLAAIGAVLGWQGLLPTILIGSVTGLLVGLSLVVFKGKDFSTPLPFGPFLSLGAVVALVLKLAAGYPGV